MRYVENNGFTCEKDLDITPQTAPNFDILGRFYAEVGAPGRDLVLEYLRTRHPILTRLCSPIIGAVYQRKLKKFNRKLTPGVVNADHFVHYKTYRLHVLRLDRRAASPA
jgi:hypothetical protein